MKWRSKAGRGLACAVLTVLVGCGAGTVGVVASLKNDSTSESTRTATTIELLTPSGGQSGLVRLPFALSLDGGETLRLDSVEYSLKGDEDEEYRTASLAEGLPNEVIAGESLNGSDLALRKTGIITLVWNSHRDVSARLQSTDPRAAIQRPITARCVFRATWTNTSTQEQFHVRTEEFFLDHRLLTTVAGGGVGDGRKPRQASMFKPSAVAMDPDGHLIVADTGNNRIRKLEIDDGEAARISTVCGNGFVGVVSGVNAARNTSMHSPIAVAARENGDIFVLEAPDLGEEEPAAGAGTATAGRVLRIIQAETGLVSVALAELPGATAIDYASGILSIGLGLEGSIWQIDVSEFDPTLEVIGPDEIAVLDVGDAPFEIAAAPAPEEALYVADASAQVVYRLEMDGVKTIILGGGDVDPIDVVNQPAGLSVLGTDLFFEDPTSVAVDDQFIYASSIGTGTIVVLSTGDYSVANVFVVDRPMGVAVGASGDLYVSEGGNDLTVSEDPESVSEPGHRILRVQDPGSQGTFAISAIAADQSLRGITPSLSGSSSQQEPLGAFYSDG